MTISNVTGDVVGYQEAVKYSGGTSGNDTGYINLAYGNNTGTAWLLFDGNLQVGEPVYLGWSMWANERVVVNGRPTGHTIINDACINITNDPQGNLTANIYADQATGATVNASVSLTSESTTTSFNYYLIATNAFKAVPEFSQIALEIVMSTLTATTAAIAYRKKVKLSP